MTITARALARLLDEEFERDDWGDIDPSMFKPCDEDDVFYLEDHKALMEVLTRVAERLNQGDGQPRVCQLEPVFCCDHPDTLRTMLPKEKECPCRCHVSFKPCDTPR